MMVKKVTTRQFGLGMPCKCGGSTSVMDTRPMRISGHPSIRRRRICANCGARFTTYEVSDSIAHNAQIKNRILAGIRELLGEIDKLLKTAGES
jgi:transcriptional regulator NrdR family protein